MQDTQVQSLGQEDLLEKEMATHSSIVAWEIPWTEEPGGPQSVGSQKSDTTEQLTLPPHHSVKFVFQTLFPSSFLLPDIFPPSCLPLPHSQGKPFQPFAVIP